MSSHWNVNTDLLQQAMKRIEDDPCSWKQDVWLIKGECGTVGCFAGHVVMAAGRHIGRVDFEDEAFVMRVHAKDTDPPHLTDSDFLILDNGEYGEEEVSTISVSCAALLELGMPRCPNFEWADLPDRASLVSQNVLMFDANHTLANLRYMVDAIVADPTNQNGTY